MRKNNKVLFGVLILVFVCMFTSACTNVKDEGTSKEPVNSEQSDKEQDDVEDTIENEDDVAGDVNDETVGDVDNNASDSGVIEMEGDYEYGEDYGEDYSDGIEIDEYFEGEE